MPSFNSSFLKFMLIFFRSLTSLFLYSGTRDRKSSISLCLCDSLNDLIPGARLIQSHGIESAMAMRAIALSGALNLWEESLHYVALEGWVSTAVQFGMQNKVSIHTHINGYFGSTVLCSMLKQCSQLVSCLSLWYLPILFHHRCYRIFILSDF